MEYREDETWWSAELRRHGREAAAGELEEVRTAAGRRAVSLGIPTTKDEEWRYTNVAPLSGIAFRQLAAGESPLPAAHDIAAVVSLFPETSQRLVFVDGCLMPQFSELSGSFEIHPLSRLLQDGSSPEGKAAVQALRETAESEFFPALNSAFAADGALVKLARGTTAAGPLVVYLIVSAQRNDIALYPRLLFIGEENTQGSLIEVHCGLGRNRYLNNSITQASLAENASFEHFKVQLDGAESFQFSTTIVSQERSSFYASYALSLGGALTRNELKITLQGEGADAQLFGLSLLRREQLVDNHTVIDHASPHATSYEWYKGVYAGKSRGVFAGTIIVQPGAQKTNAIQSNHNMLLSTEAHVDTKPQLKIWANDVKCTHGATIGQIDEESLYYLQSRGIPLEKAREMLVQAFAADILEKIKNDQVKGSMQALIARRLAEISSDRDVISSPAEAAF